MDSPPPSAPWPWRIGPTGCWTLLTLLLVLETEFFLLRNDAALYKAVRDPLGIQYPLDHIPLAFLAFASLIRLLVQGLPRLAVHPVSLRFLAGHLACVGALGLVFTWLVRFTAPRPAWIVTWVPIAAAFFGTWLATLIPPRLWWSTLARHARWVVPALVLSLAAPMAARAGANLWGPLAQVTFYSSGKLLSLVFDAPILRPEELVFGTPAFEAEIQPNCSGLEGMGLIALFTLAYLWLRREDLNFPTAFWLLPISVAASWAANCVRLVALVAVGTWLSPSLARQGFHSHAGWTAFTVIGLACFFAVEKLGCFRRKTEEPGIAEFPALAYLLPLIGLLSARVVSGAFTDGLEAYYPLRILVVALILYRCRRAYRVHFREPSAGACTLGVAVYFLWILLVDRSAAAAHPLTELPGPWGTVWLLFRVAGAVLVIPLAEELAFRGYLLRRLQSSAFEQVPVGNLTPLALAGSALAFGLLHQDWLAGVAAGLAYATPPGCPGASPMPWWPTRRPTCVWPSTSSTSTNGHSGRLRASSAGRRRWDEGVQKGGPDSSCRLMILAGTPTAVTRPGMSRTTAAAAPITLQSPMASPWMTLQPMPR